MHCDASSGCGVLAHVTIEQYQGTHLLCTLTSWIPLASGKILASLLHFKPFSHSGRHLDEARKTIACLSSLCWLFAPLPALFHQVSLSLHPAARDHFSVDLYSRDANGATDISLLAIIVVTISAHLVNLNEGKETKNTREEELHFEACYALLLDDASRAKIDPAEAVESVIASN